MIQRLTRLGVGQTAKVLGALYFLLGIVFAAIFGSMMPAAAMGDGAGMFGMGFIIAMPFLYGIIGVIFGALVAWLYNLVATWTGGLELELDSTSA